VAELATDEDDIEPPGDEQTRVAVAQAVERQPSLPAQSGPFDRQPEGVPDMAVVAVNTKSSALLKGEASHCSRWSRAIGGARSTWRFAASVLSRACSR
jgi:hypothetical protein